MVHLTAHCHIGSDAAQTSNLLAGLSLPDWELRRTWIRGEDLPGVSGYSIMRKEDGAKLVEQRGQ